MALPACIMYTASAMSHGHDEWPTLISTCITCVDNEHRKTWIKMQVMEGDGRLPNFTVNSKGNIINGEVFFDNDDIQYSPL